ncbi:MAG: hypothetical protein KA712_02835 [Myxococcales bacterium]|nr:hypothetical protein [Myxococcales bacterium]
MPFLPRRSFTLLVGGLVVFTACKQSATPAPAERVLAEVRGPDGQLRLQVARRGEDHGDERLAWYADAETAGSVQRLAGGAGTASLEGARVSLRRSETRALVMTEDGRVKFTLERRDDHLRVGDADGFPQGRIRRDGASATLHGPGGDLKAAAHVEGERVVVTDRAGTALGYVVGVPGPEEALVAFLPGLRPIEQALLLATPLPAPATP